MAIVVSLSEEATKTFMRFILIVTAFFGVRSEVTFILNWVLAGMASVERVNPMRVLITGELDETSTLDPNYVWIITGILLKLLNSFGKMIYIHELVGIATLHIKVMVKKLVWNTCKLDDDTD